MVREELGSLHGIPLYKCFVKAWPQVEAFQVRQADPLIATNPKSGEWPWGRVQVGQGDASPCNAFPVLKARRG